MKNKSLILILILALALNLGCSSKKSKNKENMIVTESLNTSKEKVINKNKKIKKSKEFRLKDLEGAWFENENENGLFYIEDSIFYLEASKSFPIWVLNNKVYVDYGFDTVGFKIKKINDTIRLFSFGGPEDGDGLFRIFE